MLMQEEPKQEIVWPPKEPMNIKINKWIQYAVMGAGALIFLLLLLTVLKVVLGW